jgi:hypothetical protein
MKPKLTPGDTVRVIGERGTAKIRAILTDVHGALLDKRIDGFRLWNLDELRLVKAKQEEVNVLVKSGFRFQKRGRDQRRR